MAAAPADNGRMTGSKATSATPYLRNTNSLVSSPSASTFTGRTHLGIANALLEAIALEELSLSVLTTLIM